MHCIGPDELMSPDKSIKDQYEKANITKVALYVDNAEGYHIKGDAVQPLFKLAGIDPERTLTTKETLTVLQTIGMEKRAAGEAMKLAVERFISSPKSGDPTVTIYGVNDDYINYGSIEKTAKPVRVKEIMSKVAKEIKRDFTKEASLLSDPESVDVMLSLNFINEDNLMSYVDSIGPMKSVIQKLAAMLIASRMGLADLNEDAIKKSMTGLQEVVDGLENVKVALGK
jgi:hypothetical protein